MSASLPNQPPRTGAENADERDPSVFDRIEQGLSFMKQCPLCHTAYPVERVTELYVEEDVHLLHAVCAQCENSFLSIVTASDFGVSSIGLYTDLSVGDVERFYRKDPITSDDVLGFHEFLHSADATFGRLLKQRKK